MARASNKTRKRETDYETRVVGPAARGAGRPGIEDLQMLDQIVPLALAALALWLGWTVVRTAVELRRELAVAVIRRSPREPSSPR